MKKYLLALLVVALYAAHQDIWFWEDAHPLLFGFLPIGFVYHGCYSLAACLLMLLVVKLAWPSHIQKRVEEELSGDASEGDLG